VKAYYQDAWRAEKGEVVVDAANAVVTSKKGPRAKGAAGVIENANPDNVKVLRHTYANKANAERAARAEWQRIQRGVANFRITLARGRPELFPELPASVQGWKPEIDGTGWVVAKVTHQLSDRGYVTGVKLEVKAQEVGD
jgi:uncharacterized protein